MFELRMTKGSKRRGCMAGAEATRGASPELFAGRIRFRRDAFPTDKESLSDRHTPYTLMQQARLARWALR